MTVLVSAVSASADAIILNAALTATPYPFGLTIESEKLTVRGGSGTRTLYVDRGQGGTTAASHAAGVTVTSGWSAGGGGSISATDGTVTVTGVTTVRLPTVAAGGAGEAIGLPTVISSTDPGAVGAGNLWVQTGVTSDAFPGLGRVALWIRNAGDTGWYVVGGVAIDGPDIYAASPDGDAYFQAFNAGQQPNTPIGFATSTAGVFLTGDGFVRAGTWADGVGANVGGLSFGTVDPSAGAGLPAVPGSMYGRNNAGTGELWLKTAAGDTAWTKVTAP